MRRLSESSTLEPMLTKILRSCHNNFHPDYEERSRDFARRLGRRRSTRLCLRVYSSLKNLRRRSQLGDI